MILAIPLGSLLWAFKGPLALYGAAVGSRYLARRAVEAGTALAGVLLYKGVRRFYRRIFR